jgi:Fuc2NAc and GlcNAc transferase
VVPDVALILLGGGFAVSVVLLAGMLVGAQRLGVYAHPNERSFHDAPKVTGGGVAFVLPLLGYLGWVAAAGNAEALALCAGGTALAVVGLLDDIREVSSLLRIAVHLVAAALLAGTVFAGGSWWLAAFVTVALAWQINLYNFMDGIDGIAGVQALVFLVGAQLVALGLPGWSGDVAWLACGGALGFLVFNFPPARLFMGDVGSGVLGLLTGALALIWWQQGTLHVVPSLILLAGFWLDASYTLIVRALTGQPFTQAHRLHLYQKVATTRGHLWTTVGFLTYASLWLLPLAWLSARFPEQPDFTTWLWLLPAAVPVLLCAWWFRAGLPEGPGERHD